MKNRKSLQERFEEFDVAHPYVYATFKTYALQLRHRRQHYGAKAIMEVMRFHRAVSGQDTEQWKINNDYASRYARKLMAEMPESFAGFFEFRQLKTQ